MTGASKISYRASCHQRGASISGVKSAESACTFLTYIVGNSGTADCLPRVVCIPAGIDT